MLQLSATEGPKKIEMAVKKELIAVGTKMKEKRSVNRDNNNNSSSSSNSRSVKKKRMVSVGPQRRGRKMVGRLFHGVLLPLSITFALVQLRQKKQSTERRFRLV